MTARSAVSATVSRQYFQSIVLDCHLKNIYISRYLHIYICQIGVNNRFSKVRTQSMIESSGAYDRDSYSVTEDKRGKCEVLVMR